MLLKTMGNSVEYVYLCILFCVFSCKVKADCFQGESKDYAGSVSRTVSGFTCQRWDSDIPHYNFNPDPAKYPDASLSDAGNYCRDPCEIGTPWCYTTDNNTIWENCDIQKCGNCFKGEAKDYAGSVSRTVSGFMCQRWDSDTPHFNLYPDPTKYPDASLSDAGNYCRDPSGTGTPWCYTTDPNKRWENCDIQKCSNIKYRVRVKATRHKPSGYVVLDGSANTGVILPLNTTNAKEGGVRVGEVAALNVGNVKKIQYRSPTATNEAQNPDFVSLHKSDDNGFYIERFVKMDDQMHSPCARQFGKPLHLQPSNWARLLEKYAHFTEVNDETDCKLRCIESDTFDCRIAYYSTYHRRCYIFPQTDDNYYSQTDSEYSFFFNRTDNCRVQGWVEY